MVPSSRKNQSKAKASSFSPSHYRTSRSKLSSYKCTTNVQEIENKSSRFRSLKCNIKTQLIT